MSHKKEQARNEGWALVAILALLTIVALIGCLNLRVALEMGTRVTVNLASPQVVTPVPPPVPPIKPQAPGVPESEVAELRDKVQALENVAQRSIAREEDLHQRLSSVEGFLESLGGDDRDEAHNGPVALVVQ